MPYLVGEAVDVTWSRADIEKGIHPVSNCYITLVNIPKTF